MKKVLLGTSAIALASAVAGPASAAEFDRKWGGIGESWLGYGSTDDPAGLAPATAAATRAGIDIDGVDAKWDGEIIFDPSITLDNGLKIGTNIQLEGRASSAGGGGTGDVIDEAYIYIRGSFGEINIGDENSAGYKMSYAAPDVSFLGINSPSSTIFVPYSGALNGVSIGADLFRGTLGTTFLENERNNDAGRITYYTPRFAGFQLGFSYARDSTQNTNGMINTAGATAKDIFDVGANYVNSFGDFDVAVSGRWGIATDDRSAAAARTAYGASLVAAGVPAAAAAAIAARPDVAADIGSNPEIWGAGINLGYAGFTIGGSFSEQNKAGSQDGISYDAGVSYRTGPWGFSFTYLHGENVNNENMFGDGVGRAARPGALATTFVGGVDEEVDNFIAAVDYDLAKGVDLNLVGGYTDFDEDQSDPAGVGAGTGGNDLDGFYVATGIRLRF